MRIFRESLLVLLVLTWTSPACADWKPYCERSDGVHRVVALELSEGLRFEGKNRDVQPAQRLHLIFRNDELKAWWFIGHGWEAMHQQASSVRLTDDGIRGELSLRIYDVRGRLQLTADLAFSIDREHNGFDGTFAGKVAGVVDRSWDGRARGSFLPPTDMFAPTADWPSFSGPSGTLATSPNGPAMIDDLRKSRPLWRSETAVPVSYGNAADDRYADRAAGCRPGGGSSSPVYADGVVYIGFYTPNRSFDPPWDSIPEAWRNRYSGEGLQKLTRERRLNEVELAAIKDHWRPVADDVIVALDARTGKTLWRTTWPARVFNLQTHKHRGTFGVPLVAGGKVFYPNFQNGLEVMDAKTGEPLWEFPEFAGPPTRRFKPSGPPSQSPILFDDTVVWSVGRTTYGLSAATGEVLWENSNAEGYNDHGLREVTLGNRRFVLVAGHRHLSSSTVRLINPSTGNSVWSEEVGLLGVFEGQFANALAVSGDTLVAFRPHIPAPNLKTNRISKEMVTHHLHAWRLSMSGVTHLWQDKHLPPDEGPHLAIANGVVYGVGRHLVRCLDLKTGKVLGEITAEEFPHPADSPHGDAPGSNPLLIVSGDKLFLSPEGQHGRHGFILFDADPSRLTLYGDRERKWIPPHASTTAYGRQPIVNPIVDGRVFFRGGNGIYCYDLRQSRSH